MRFRAFTLVLCLLATRESVVPSPAIAHGEASAPARRTAAPANSAERESAYRENNLGVALLEQFRFGDAAEAFRRALAKDPTLALARTNLAIALFYVPDLEGARREAEAVVQLAPDQPQANYVLGLVARTEGRAEDAVPYLRRVLARDPRDLGANVTLGQVFLQTRQFEEAKAAFEVAAEAEPYNVSAAYNLGVALNRGGHREEAQLAMERFQKLRDSAYKTSLGTTYLEQGQYAEALSSTGAEPETVDPQNPPVAFVEAAGALPAVGPAATPSAAAVPVGAILPPDAVQGLPRAALLVADLDGDDALDVVEARLSGLRVLRNEKGRLRDVTERVGLSGVPALGAVAGDYDNDAHPDLLVLRPAGLALFRNEGDGRFKETTATARVPTWPHLTVSAAFLDADHDGDLDVFVAGLVDLTPPSGGRTRFPDDFAPAPALLLQNGGDGTFTDVTASAGLGDPAHALAVIPTDFDNRRDTDLFVLRSDRPALYKNLRDGSFRDVALDLGLSAKGPFLSAAAGDVNKDSYTDFFLGGAGPSFLALSDGRGGFRVGPAPEGSDGARAAQLVDYDNDGLIDLLVVSGLGPRLYRNVGGSWTDASATAFADSARRASLEGAALGLGDLDLDGDRDALVAGADRLLYLRNDGGNRNRSFAVNLAGRVSNRGGVGAKIEIRAGSLRQKHETVAAVPMPAPADVIFGLGSRSAPDAVRVIWVSGIVQTESDVPAPEPGRRASLGIMELDRKPSSCPFLYAWNGERFEFVSDFLGAGEMGYWVAPGVRSDPDPVEYVRIAPGGLQPRDGRYELRVTNELEEVLYLDRLRLLAVDHPADVAVHPDEGMTAPPKAFRLLGSRDPRAPRAMDHRGRDVTERTARRDRVFVDDLPLERIRGYAREHSLTLDLSALPSTHSRLLLTGWTDYAFSSDNVAAHQAGRSLRGPSLQVERADGSWETVVEQIGVPVGRPQTIVVDLEGRWRGPSRQVRIVTTMRVYWDEILAAAPVDVSVLRPAVLDPVRAELRERGFSAETSPDGREPWSYDYARVSWLSPWKTMPGRYTREGDVRPLLAAADDVFVVSKPGDEVALSFDRRALAAVRPGFARTFLVLGDGYSKEMDINSASPDVVTPLPYHGMKSYPYDEADAPEGVRARQAAAVEAWNQRLVARPLVPLELVAAGEDVVSRRPRSAGHP